MLADHPRRHPLALPLRPLGRRIDKQRLHADGTVAAQIDFSWDGTVLAEQTTSGTPTELFDPAGGIAWHQTTTFWGLALPQPRPAAYTPLRFPGQYHDPETGHNYNFYRYYSPVEGIFASADPLGRSGGPNPHAYVPNPIGYLDPLGLAAYKRRHEVDPRTLGKRRNYTHRVEFHAEPGTRDWFKQYEIKPTNEPGRYAVPADKIDEFNRRVRRVVVTRR